MYSQDVNAGLGLTRLWFQNGLTLPGGMKGEKYDYLAELVSSPSSTPVYITDATCYQVVTQELARMGARGFQDGLSAGMWIGLTPILNYGTAAQKASIIGPVLAGDKHICLAISEPFAGSDVAGMKTKAVLSKDGKHFIVNGTKVSCSLASRSGWGTRD